MAKGRQKAEPELIPKGMDVTTKLSGVPEAFPVGEAATSTTYWNNSSLV